MLYKYRGLTNLEFALDILVNQRMFAADFKSLNDPMEGTYRYERGALTQSQIDAIYENKMSYRLLSLSETPNNLLMWSYYADSHHGMVVGVSVIDPDAPVEPVRYVRNLSYVRTLSVDTPNLAKEILIKKFDMWRHEQEHRAFIRNESFVKVKIEELIFGIHTKPQLKEILSSIAEKFCPDVRVRTIERHELDTGERNELDG